VCDLTIDMLREGKSKAHNKGILTINWHNSNAENLPYVDNCFDMILCSHVLEHVDDDRKAMSELFRILKPSGFGIIMVPIDINLKEDFENPEYKTEAERWKYFGQNDHVRLYSKNGFATKLIQTGFKVNQLGIDYFGADVFEKNGIHPRSVLYVVEK
jgi:ubiquinone/menaquinone biosynthesis C-methylase UbiE